jgi:hypothetical protein
VQRKTIKGIWACQKKIMAYTSLIGFLALVFIPHPIEEMQQLQRKQG